MCRTQGRTPVDLADLADLDGEALEITVTLPVALGEGTANRKTVYLSLDARQRVSLARLVDGLVGKQARLDRVARAAGIP